MASIREPRPPRRETYCVRFRDLEGNEHEVGAGRTHGEAEKVKRQVEDWLADGVNPTRMLMTFGDVMEHFFMEHVLPHLSPKTASDYKSAYEHYFLPVWGDRQYATITHDGAKRLFAQIAKSHVCNKTHNNVMVPLKKMGKWAEEENYAFHDPFSRLKHLPVEECEMLFFTPEQLNLVVDACTAYDGFYRRHILFAGWTGLRLGELQELRFKDIKWDFGRPKIHVQRAYKGSDIVGPPKSGKHRWVGAPGHIAVLLAEAKADYWTSDDDLVFPAHNGGRFDQSNLRQRVFYPALVSLGWREPAEKKKRPKKGQGARIGRGYCPKKQPANSQQDYRLHDLRHTYAYIFLSRAHGDIYALKETMGHADIQTTMKYAHFTEDDANRAADALDSAWDNLSSSQDSQIDDDASDGSVGQDVGQGI